MSGKLIIVEDEFVIAQDLRRICASLGYGVMSIAKSANEALQKIEKERPDLALLDINLFGEMDGVDLAKTIKKRFDLPFIFVTSYSDTHTLKNIDETGPLGYVLKPFDERDIRVALELSFTRMQRNVPQAVLRNTKKKPSNPVENHIIGESPCMKTALKKVHQVACTDVAVLLQGETGTGKELFMEAIHRASPRHKNNLVKVNCAALPAELIESVLFGHEKGSFTGATEKRIGKFELADKGTIFLDEIGELPLSSQSKLLRCLQEKEIETIGGQQTKKVDVRVVAATNRNLAEDVQKGLFRADLFFRLNIFPICIPPLKNRGNDVLLLAEHYLKITARSMNKNITSIADKTMEGFKSYCWPGNVRELKHCIERGVILAENSELSIEILVNSESNPIPHREEFQLKSLEEVEREQIINTLQYCNGKVRGKGGAAEILKLHPNTLDFRIKKLGITKTKDFKANSM